MRAELPSVELWERDQVLVSAWLTGPQSARTRRAYTGDVAAWYRRPTAGRTHVDLWADTDADTAPGAAYCGRGAAATAQVHRDGRRLR